MFAIFNIFSKNDSQFANREPIIGTLLWFFTSISNCDLKYIQGFVCFYCYKIILFKNISFASEYPERMSAGSNLFVVGIVAWSLGDYLTRSFYVSHVTTWLLIKNVHLFCYHWSCFRWSCKFIWHLVAILWMFLLLRINSMLFFLILLERHMHKVCEV